MNWKDYPESLEFLKKEGHKHSDVKLTKILRERYPQEKITKEGVRWKRYQVGVKKPEDFSIKRPTDDELRPTDDLELSVKYYKELYEKSKREADRTTLILDRMSQAQSVAKPSQPFKLKRVAEADPETWVQLFSDGQIGQEAKRSETGFYDYNIKIFEKRLNYLFEKLVYIVELHRKSIPIRDLHLICLGDNMENEIIFAGQPFLIELDVMEQFFAGVELVSRFILDLSKHFENIHTHWISGNHGRMGKMGEHKWTVNWDYLFAKFIEQKLSACKTITFDVPKKWWNIITIEGWKFLLVHGEDIRRYMKFPWYDTARFDADYSKILQSINQDFTYMVFAHHHVPIQWDSAYGERIANGTFVGYNVYALKRLRASVRPTQVTFGVHKRMGITSRYLVRLDRSK